jgi:hypothetical protein
MSGVINKQLLLVSKDSPRFLQLLSAEKWQTVPYLVVGGAFVNPLFSLFDYYAFGEQAGPIIVARLAVALLIGGVYLASRQQHWSPETLMHFFFTLLSLHTCFLLSLVPARLVEAMLITYGLLYIGFGLLTIWSPINLVVHFLISYLGIAFFGSLNPVINLRTLYLHGGSEFVLAGAISILVGHWRLGMVRRALQARLVAEEALAELALRNEQLSHQQEALKVQQKIIDEYEQRLSALSPTNET